MMAGMITIENVTKRYGGFTAVDGVSFVARPGKITGFLGPNGAGKSTSMRIMVGLTPQDGGQALIGGHRYADIPNPARHVGVLLDASAQHGGRTATDAGSRRLLLTHIPPWHDPEQVLAEAAKAYDGDVALATPGTTYDV